MKKLKRNKDLTPGKIIAAILFVALLSGLVIFTIYYDPNDQYSNSFFDDVSETMKFDN